MSLTFRAIVVFTTIVAAYIYQQYYNVHVGVSPTWPLEAAVDFLPEGTPSVFAIADIHGDYKRALAALVHAGVVNTSGEWTAGNATLVQTGDIVDRGPDTRMLYAWMRNLTIQAKAQGGQVIHLYGNHEYMNAMHDWRYVDEGDFASFPEPRERNRLSAFSTYGEIGSDWLLDYTITYLDPFYRAHFMHAGLSTEFATVETDRIGQKFMRNLLNGKRSHMQWEEIESWFWGPEGPMWYRGYALLPEDEACEIAHEVMIALDADFLVMGHTPQFEGAVTRCGGRVMLIDTGLSSAYGGRPVVLEFYRSRAGHTEAKLWYDDDASTEVIYPDEP